MSGEKPLRDYVGPTGSLGYDLLALVTDPTVDPKTVNDEVDYLLRAEGGTKQDERARKRERLIQNRQAHIAQTAIVKSPYVVDSALRILIGRTERARQSLENMDKPSET